MPDTIKLPPNVESRWNDAHPQLVGLAVEEFEKQFLADELVIARAEERARILAVIRKRCRLPIGDVVEFIDELEELTKKD